MDFMNIKDLYLSLLKFANIKKHNEDSPTLLLLGGGIGFLLGAITVFVLMKYSRRAPSSVNNSQQEEIKKDGPKANNKNKAKKINELNDVQTGDEEKKQNESKDINEHSKEGKSQYTLYSTIKQEKKKKVKQEKKPEENKFVEKKTDVNTDSQIKKEDDEWKVAKKGKSKGF